MKKYIFSAFLALALVSTYIPYSRAAGNDHPHHSFLDHCRKYLSEKTLSGGQKVRFPDTFSTATETLQFGELGWIVVYDKKSGDITMTAQWEPEALLFSKTMSTQSAHPMNTYNRSVDVRHAITKVLGGFVHNEKIYLVTDSGLVSVQPLERGRYRDAWRRLWTGRPTGEASQVVSLLTGMEYVHTGRFETEYVTPQAIEVDAFIQRELPNGTTSMAFTSAYEHNAIYHYTLADDRLIFKEKTFHSGKAEQIRHEYRNSFEKKPDTEQAYR